MTKARRVVDGAHVVYAVAVDDDDVQTIERHRLP